jgi:hypothetical protein
VCLPGKHAHVTLPTQQPPWENERQPEPPDRRDEAEKGLPLTDGPITYAPAVERWRLPMSVSVGHNQILSSNVNQVWC